MQLVDVVDIARRCQLVKDLSVTDFLLSLLLPKLHFLEHYVYLIRRYGTTDNYNTEATERLHIDIVKDAFRATNHKDHTEQMIRWLSRREKVNVFDARVSWAVEQEAERFDQQHKKKKKRRKTSFKTRVQLAERPSSRNGHPAQRERHGTGNPKRTARRYSRCRRHRALDRPCSLREISVVQVYRGRAGPS